MKLYYNTKVPGHEEIKKRLDDLTLAYEIEQVTIAEVKLKDGSLYYIGESEVAKHIDEIAGELHSWYYCNC